jgi:hypothetical protein
LEDLEILMKKNGKQQLRKSLAAGLVSGLALFATSA